MASTEEDNTAESLSEALDSPNFDAIAFINRAFPTEASLSKLDTFIVKVGSQISVLDEEISRSVQSQATSQQKASTEICAAQQSIKELFSKISDIKAKASQSERMVHEICADIKKLDFAKTHLQSSITSLKRLQMLMTAVGQLELLAHEYHYREAANLLDAVNQLLGHFKLYTAIPLIAGVQQRVDVIKSDLKRHVHRAFREIGQLVDTVADPREMLSELPGGMRALSDACLVVDALGPASRRELLEEFVQLQLVPYERLFGSDGAGRHFSLDDVERRWAWFKRLLATVDSKFSNICPAHWRLPLRLCLEFTERTKIHLVTLLTMMESRDETDVHALLKALQTTLRFEQEMGARFGLDEIVKETMREAAARDLENGPHRGKSTLAFEPAAKINNQSLRDQDRVHYLPTDHTDINAADEEESGFLHLAHATISCGMSGVFDKFLGSYVLLERQNLEDMLQKLAQEEDCAASADSTASSSSAAGAATGNIYSSSMSMFVFIKNSIKRCTTLTTGTTFLALVKEFQACMSKYSEFLKARCPPPPLHRIPAGGEVAICYLINTGEYCSTVVPQLEGLIKTKIAPHLADKVDLSEQVDVFLDLVSHSLKVLVAGVLDRMEPSFKAMQGMPWGTLAQVNEESQYIHSCSSVLVEAVPKVREALTESYFRTFCTKVASEVLQRYLDVILRQKRIAEVGSQQLLLDLYNLKTLLLHLQHLGNTTDSATRGSSASAAASAAAAAAAVPAVYTKLIVARTTHIETVLKLVSTAEEMLVERFRIMWPDGTPADLASVMALKGVSKKDQGPILEATFGAFAVAAATSSAMPLSGGAGATQQPPPSSSSSSSSFSMPGLSSINTAASSSMRSVANEISAAAAATKKLVSINPSSILSVASSSSSATSASASASASAPSND